MNAIQAFSGISQSENLEAVYKKLILPEVMYFLNTWKLSFTDSHFGIVMIFEIIISLISGSITNRSH